MSKEFHKVVLDDFDIHVDELSGLAQKLCFDLYGATVSKRTAEGIMSGARKHIQKKKELLQSGGDLEFVEEKYTFAESGSKTIEKIIQLSGSEMQNPAIIMRKMGLDPIQWTLKSSKMYRKAYQTPMKLHIGYDEDGNRLPEKPHKETSYSYNCEITVEPIQSMLRTQDILEAIKGLTAKAPKRNYKLTETGKMLELPIMDDHWGLYAWKGETGDADWNLEIAERVHREVIENIIHKADKKYDLVYFPVGQDTFHIDTVHHTTTSGTPMDTAGRWPEIYSTALQAKIWAIEQLRRLGPVTVFHVPGNHDEMLSYAAVQSIAHYYRDCDDVTIPGTPFPNPQPRKYIRYGVNHIGFSHARKENKKNLEGIMQTEDKGNWGKTVFHEMHLGDLHHERTWETNGIIFRRISSISPVSSWESGKAYKGSVRKALAYEWNKKTGLDRIIVGSVVL